jgi:uncharacterized OB-fold protein
MEERLPQPTSAQTRPESGGSEPQPVLLKAASVALDSEGDFVLIGGRCGACGLCMFPRAPVCSSCTSEEVTAQQMPKSGTLYAFSVVHSGPRRWLKPYVVGYVDLPNDVRVFAHLKGEGLAIGDTVEVDVDVVGTDERGQPLQNFIFRKGRNS